MGLAIEISFDIGKNNITETKNLLSEIANKYNSSTNYFIHEIEGHNNIIDRNDCINIVEFDYIKEDIINYIKHIDKYKFIKIDCIYQESKDVNLIYASKKYLLLTGNPKITNNSIKLNSSTSIIKAIEDLI